MKAMKAMKATPEEKASEKEMKKQKEKEDESRIVNLTVNKIYKDLIDPYVAKKKAGDKAEAEESALLKKFFQVSNNVRNEIKKISPKLYDNFLKPKYDEYMMRKDKLSMESKQEMKDIRKSAQEEKRMLKKTKVEE
jgi:exonuclease III